jgi:hypothetical protein
MPVEDYTDLLAERVYDGFTSTAEERIAEAKGQDGLLADILHLVNHSDRGAT